MARGEPAPALSVHTSAGVPVGPLENFLGELAPLLPWCQPHASELLRSAGEPTDDWFVALQTEGGSAVLAACDLLLQLQHLDADAGEAPPLGEGPRNLVAVGAHSYHGPGSSAFGAAAPLGAGSKPRQQVTYPVPSALVPADPAHGGGGGPGAGGCFEAAACAALDGFFAQHGKNVAVLLVEPQWGSSQCGLPWPPGVFRHLVRRAKAHGIMVCADEILCGGPPIPSLVSFLAPAPPPATALAGPMSPRLL